MPQDTPIAASSADESGEARAQLARGGERGRGVVVALGRRAEHAQRAVPLELVDQAAVLADHIDDRGEEAVQQVDHPSGRSRAASAVDPTTSTNRAATVRCSPPSATPRSSASRATSSPTCLPNSSRMRSSLAQALEHLVEAGLQASDLGGVVDLHVELDVTLADAVHRVAQRAYRPGDALGDDLHPDQADHDREPGDERDRRRQVLGRRAAGPNGIEMMPISGTALRSAQVRMMRGPMPSERSPFGDFGSST